MTKIESCLLPMMLGAAAFMVGCAPDQTAPGQPEDVTDVEVALSTVPAGVQCVKVSVTIGSTTTTPPLTTVAAGASSASLNIGQLGTGNATFNGAAFNGACSTVTGSTVANWIAVPVTTTLSLGVSNKVSITFLPNNAVSVSANFLPAPVELALGVESTFVRMADGTVRQWGLVPTNSIVLQPTPVPGLTDAVQLAAGQFQMACARRATGDVSCWGDATNWGGSGVTATPVPIGIGNPVSQISVGGNFGCGMYVNQVTCWGSNTFGAFGNGTTGYVGAPKFTGNYGGRMFAGRDHACLLGADGTVYCAGSNSNGQLGLGNTTDTNLLYQVVGVAGTVDLAASRFHTCAVRGDGTVRCWGWNGGGQLGDGTLTQRTSPVQVVGLNDAVHVVVGESHTCALRQGGTVSCWGAGSTLGDGLGQNRPTPADVPGLSGVIALDSHMGYHTCAILMDRTVKCWGENGEGQVDGTLVWAAKPVTVALQ